MSNTSVKSEVLLGKIQLWRAKLLEERSKLCADSIEKFKQGTVGFLWWKRQVTVEEAMQNYRDDLTMVHYYDHFHGSVQLRILANLELLAFNSETVTITSEDAWVLRG